MQHSSDYHNLRSENIQAQNTHARSALSKPLHDRAMLADLTLEMYSGRKLDKSASSDITTMKGARAGQASVYKSLVDREKHLRPISQLHNKVRTYHYEHTLPWFRKGADILTAAAYQDYMLFMSDSRMQHDRLVQVFRDSFEDAIETAKAELGAMFNPLNYPPVEMVVRKFGFHVEILPLPRIEDFRLQSTLTPEERSMLENKAGDALGNRLVKAHKDLIGRLLEVVQHFAQVMQDPDKVFHGSTVANIGKICDLVPKLNLLGDTGLDALANKVQASLAGLDPDALRNSKKLREQAATDAAQAVKAIESQMAGIF